MKRVIHELSDYDKQDVADDLMLPTGVFGAVLLAGLLCLALIWHPNALFSRGTAPASIALRNANPSTEPNTLWISGRQAGPHGVAVE